MPAHVRRLSRHVVHQLQMMGGCTTTKLPALAVRGNNHRISVIVRRGAVCGRRRAARLPVRRIPTRGMAHAGTEVADIRRMDVRGNMPRRPAVTTGRRRLRPRRRCRTASSSRRGRPSWSKQRHQGLPSSSTAAAHPSAASGSRRSHSRCSGRKCSA